MEGKPLKDTKLGAWFRNKAPEVLEAIGSVIPGGDALKAIGALIECIYRKRRGEGRSADATH
jgi:hypothetical protein